MLSVPQEAVATAAGAGAGPLMDPQADIPEGTSRDDELRAEEVVAAVARSAGAACPDCRAALCGHEVVLSLMMGARDAPRCAPCLARGVRQEPEVFARRAMEHVRRRDCFLAGWTYATARERDAGTAAACRLPEGLTVKLAADEHEPQPGPSAPESGGPEPLADEHFDAGDTGCGELTLALRTRLRAMSPGAILEVRTTDHGAPADLPAWCRLTRNELVCARPPLYWIERRDD